MSRLVLVVLLLALVGCTQAPTTPVSQTNPSANPSVVTTSPDGMVPQVSPGEQTPLSTQASAATASMLGRVVSNTDGKPISQTVVALAKVYRDANDPNRAAFALDLANSPATFTTDDGSFQFNSVEPGEYVISVGDLNGTKDIVREANGDARVYKLETDQAVDTGVVQVQPNVSMGS